MIIISPIFEGSKPSRMGDIIIKLFLDESSVDYRIPHHIMYPTQEIYLLQSDDPVLLQYICAIGHGSMLSNFCSGATSAPPSSIREQLFSLTTKALSSVPFIAVDHRVPEVEA